MPSATSRPLWLGAVLHLVVGDVPPRLRRRPHTVGTVSPGDQIAAAVYYNNSTGQYNLTLSDGSRR
jgi:hypothetical protein